jgi:hypothetical protein
VICLYADMVMDAGRLPLPLRDPSRYSDYGDHTRARWGIGHLSHEGPTQTHTEAARGIVSAIGAR